MTPAEAQEFFVIPNLSYEQPFLMQKAFEFALFLVSSVKLRKVAERGDFDYTGQRALISSSTTDLWH